VACMMGLEGIVSKPIVPDHRAIGYVAGLNALEPVSGESRTSLCSTGNSCRENVCRGQRPGRHFWRHQPIARDEAAVSRVCGRKATESQRLFRQRRPIMRGALITDAVGTQRSRYRGDHAISAAQKFRMAPPQSDRLAP
jgi:hypothetical protein